jgi:hypothetical protein
MKFPAFFLVPLLCAAAGTSNDIESLIDQARRAPGEFAADVLIRLAALDKLEKTRRIELLADAFQRAAEAQQPYKRHAATLSMESTAGYSNRAYSQDLDGLSLRLRAIEALLPLDTRKARDLFLRIPNLNLPRVGCDDLLVYDVARYYDVLGAIARQAFTAEEAQKGGPYSLLAYHAGTVASPVQVAPMARAVASSGLKDGEFQALVSAFAGSLGRIAGDDRSFTDSRRAGSDILALAEECRRRQISPLSLIENYRLYLVNHLTGKRCADSGPGDNSGTSFGLAGGRPAAVPADAVSFFNDSLRVPPIQAILADETTPASVETPAAGLRACRDAECLAIAAQYRGLILGPGGSPYPNSYRETGEWRARLREFLSAMADWRESSGATAAEYYREKCGFFTEALNLVPNGPDREPVVRALLDFVRQNRFQAENPPEWFLPVNALLGHMALDPAGLGRLAPALRNSGDPVIALYAALETVAPRGPERLMPLL